MALIMKKRLLECGYEWHADRLDNWIHRVQAVQPKRADLLEEKKEASF
jgi:hypothetical protein